MTVEEREKEKECPMRRCSISILNRVLVQLYPYSDPVHAQPQ